MPQAEIYSIKKRIDVVKIGTRVRHLGRLDVGEGRITSTYAGGYCDAEFLKCKFSGVPADCFCSVEDFQRERLRRDEKVKLALERARAREAQKAQEELARREVLRKIRFGHQLSSDEREILRSLSVTEQLMHFTKTEFVAPFLDELVPLLGRASADKSMSDALDEFWNAHAPTAECLPLIPLAPLWWREWHWHSVKYAHLLFPEKLKVLSNPTLQLSESLRRNLIREIVDRYASNNSFDEALAKASIRVTSRCMPATRMIAEGTPTSCRHSCGEATCMQSGIPD